MKHTKIPEEFHKEVELFPPELRTLLQAELDSGNEIEEIGHSFPASPVGAFIKLKRCVSTRPREANDGLSFRERNSSLSSGEFTDEKGHFFILNPPVPESEQKSMDEIRSATTKTITENNLDRSPDTALKRFEQSMIIDYEKWHDGIGYDLSALNEASAFDRKAIEKILIERGAHDWRDVEALADLNSDPARQILKEAINSSDAEVRSAILKHAPELISDSDQIHSVVEALKTAEFYSGLTQTLDYVAGFHPSEVIEELFRGVLNRSGDVAVHFAAMLLFIHGKATERFDMKQRPFFLRFNTDNRTERKTAFRALCKKIGIESKKYLKA